MSRLFILIYDIWHVSEPKYSNLATVKTKESHKIGSIPMNKYMLFNPISQFVLKKQAQYKTNLLVFLPYFVALDSLYTL